MAMQALVMGFGGTGAEILTYLKEIAVLKQGELPPGLKFLLFDTIADWKPGKDNPIHDGAVTEVIAKGEEISLDPDSEYHYLEDHKPFLSDYVYRLLTPVGQPDNYPHLKNWLHIHWIRQHLTKDKTNITEGAAQQRQIGRFAMFQNANKIIPRITQELRDLRQGQANVNVWIIGSAAGGTGAGTMLDAAFMTRLAAGNMAIQITGVIALPDVYDDKDGISRARAYSLFRELDRFQEVGIDPGANHQYIAGGAQNTLVSSEVFYDARRDRHSLVESKLFDNLFYIGKLCRNDNARKTFFGSVANALDPFLDIEQGRELLQKSVNDLGFAASSFGAARLYVPLETYKALFAWEEVIDYLEAISAPKKEQGIIKDVYFGAKGDRKAKAEANVKAVLHLFEELLEWVNESDEKIVTRSKERLLPETIVTVWYQASGSGSLAGTNITGEEQKKIRWTYVNPYISMTEANVAKVKPQDIEVKTFEENRKSKGPKEEQEESRDQFAKDLDKITTRYTSEEGGNDSFVAGAKQIFDTVSGMLSERIDKRIIGELQGASSIAWKDHNHEEGTAMTRLYEELAMIIADDGPLNAIQRVLQVSVNSLNQEEDFRKNQAINASNTLRDSEKPKWSSPWKVWVEEHQQAARNQCFQYIRWHQKRGLLGDMQELVNKVKERYEQWYKVFRCLLDGIAIRRTEEQPALSRVQNECKHLDKRLYRLAGNGSALISLQEGERDMTMQGYRYELKQRAVVVSGESLAREALKTSKWEHNVSGSGDIEVSLVFKWKENDAQDETVTLTKPNELRGLHKELYQRFKRRIDARLEGHSIFDYLSYSQTTHSTSWDDVIRRLNTEASVLIQTSAPAVSQLAYKEPDDQSKQAICGALQRALLKIDNQAQDELDSYSDPNALTLLKICKPEPGDVAEVDACQNDYLTKQGQNLTGSFQNDEELYRAQVYHPFRAEMEAWYIERNYARRQNHRLGANDQIPHRIVRLLEYPDMMQAFVHCVATGAVEKDSRDIWVFHNTELNSDIELTTTDEPTADIVRAAVIFVLQQKDAKPTSTVRITYDHAMKSAENRAKAAGQNQPDMVEKFVKGQELDEFLKNNFGDGGAEDDEEAIGFTPEDEEKIQREKLGLKMIFQFYGNRRRRTTLKDREKLP